MRTAVESGQELVRCPVCDAYLKKEEGFCCPRCKRGPLCKSHRVAGRRECAGCVLDLQSKELIELRDQERSLSSFLKLLQFLFIVFAILFVAARTGSIEVLAFLQDSFIMDGIGYLGGAAVMGYVIFYLIRLGQRHRIRQMEFELNKAVLKRL
jgi:hypothetical protein